jgi:hypothetical protein
MTDRPIIFSGPMVRALLAGQKTQTRRLLKPAPDTAKISAPFHPEPRGGQRWVFMARDDFPEYAYATADFKVPYAVGDRLYVRENFYTQGGAFGEGFGYAADLPPEHGPPKLIPCIHMPRHLSRLTLTVTDVKVERLQDISEEDARAEGIVPSQHGGWWVEGNSVLSGHTARDAFMRLWGHIHGAESWQANPWLVAPTFTVEQRNIDAAKLAA